MLSISQETPCSYEIKCSVMHRLTHLHAVCSNRPDSGAQLLPFQLETETGEGAQTLGTGRVVPRSSLLPPRTTRGCRRWELLWSEGGFSLLHSACVTLPFFKGSAVIRSPPASRGAGRISSLSGGLAVQALHTRTAWSTFAAVRRAHASDQKRSLLPRSPGSGSQQMLPAVLPACAPRF